MNRVEVALLSFDSAAHGGVQRYTRLVMAALRVADLEATLVEIGTTTRQTPVGGWEKLRGGAEALRRLVRLRPKVIWATHPNLAPVGLAASITASSRFVVTVHGTDGWSRLRPLTLASLKSAHALLPVSRFTAAVTRDLNCRQVVVPNAVDPALAKQLVAVHESPAKARDEPIAAVMISRLDRDFEDKGGETVFRLALEGLLRVRIIGDGPRRDLLTAAAPPNVKFAGAVDDSGLASEYAAADLVLLLSDLRFGRNPAGEGFGIVVAEGAMAARPAVVTASGGTTDAVIGGVTGWILPIRPTLSELRSVVSSASERGRIPNMGRSARELALERYSFEQLVGNVRKVVEL